MVFYYQVSLKSFYRLQNWVTVIIALNQRNNRAVSGYTSDGRRKSSKSHCVWPSVDVQESRGQLSSPWLLRSPCTCNKEESRLFVGIDARSRIYIHTLRKGTNERARAHVITQGICAQGRATAWLLSTYTHIHTGELAPACTHHEAMYKCSGFRERILNLSKRARDFSERGTGFLLQLITFINYLKRYNEGKRLWDFGKEKSAWSEAVYQS